MEPIRLELTKSDAMTLEMILDSYKRQVSMNTLGCSTAHRIQRLIRKAIEHGN